MDPLTISLIIAIFAGIALIIARLHLKKCHSLCCDSDCTRSTPKNSTSHLTSTSSNCTETVSAASTIVSTIAPNSTSVSPYCYPKQSNRQEKKNYCPEVGRKEFCEHKSSCSNNNCGDPKLYSLGLELLAFRQCFLCLQ